MIKFKFMPLMAISLLAGNVYALSGHGFEIISEKIETSSGVSGGVRPATVKAPGMAMAWAMAYDADGKAGQNVQVSGSHTLDIKNDTRQDQYYTYKYELSCDGQYLRKTDNILLHPGGRIDDGGMSYLNTYHAVGGVFKIVAVTRITGESSHEFVDEGVLRLTQ